MIRPEGQHGVVDRDAHLLPDLKALAVVRARDDQRVIQQAQSQALMVPVEFGLLDAHRPVCREPQSFRA